MSDGLTIVAEALHQRGSREEVQSYCFYHAQSVSSVAPTGVNVELSLLLPNGLVESRLVLETHELMTAQARPPRRCILSCFNIEHLKSQSDRPPLRGFRSLVFFPSFDFCFHLLGGNRVNNEIVTETARDLSRSGVTLNRWILDQDDRYPIERPMAEQFRENLPRTFSAGVPHTWNNDQLPAEIEPKLKPLDVIHRLVNRCSSLQKIRT